MLNLRSLTKHDITHVLHRNEDMHVTCWPNSWLESTALTEMTATLPEWGKSNCRTPMTIAAMTESTPTRLSRRVIKPVNQDLHSSAAAQTTPAHSDCFQLGNLILQWIHTWLQARSCIKKASANPVANLAACCVTGDRANSHDVLVFLMFRSLQPTELSQSVNRIVAPCPAAAVFGLVICQYMFAFAAEQRYM